MAEPPSYLLCGTPRTGSTLLCSLLSSTGVLGSPQSYFREPDEVTWAHRFGLRTDGSRVADYGAFVQAARDAGTSANGVFAARIMWGSLDRLVAGLGETGGKAGAKEGGQAELATLERALGPLRFVHLQREDRVGQAVSWARAEQTGAWQDGDVASGSAQLDLDLLRQLVRTVDDHTAAWRSWFERHGVRPRVVTYEELVADPHAVVAGIADHLGVELPARWRPDAPQRRQADQVSASWAAALRADLEARPQA